MKENYTVCNCMNVSYGNIADALHMNQKFDDVLKAFDFVQMQTKCSTGCGGCHDKVMGVISDILMGNEQV